MVPMVPIAQYKVWLPSWRCEVTLLITEKGPYNIIGEICAIMGVARARDQRDSLRERRATRPYVDQIIARTSGGPQPAWCIHQRALGYWLGIIPDKKLRASMADRLVDFQSDLIDASHDCLFGTVEGTAESRIIYLQDRLGGTSDPIVMPQSDDESE